MRCVAVILVVLAVACVLPAFAADKHLDESVVRANLDTAFQRWNEIKSGLFKKFLARHKPGEGAVETVAWKGNIDWKGPEETIKVSLKWDGGSEPQWFVKILYNGRFPFEKEFGDSGIFLMGDFLGEFTGKEIVILNPDDLGKTELDQERIDRAENLGEEDRAKGVLVDWRGIKGVDGYYLEDPLGCDPRPYYISLYVWSRQTPCAGYDGTTDRRYYRDLPKMYLLDELAERISRPDMVDEIYSMAIN